MRNEVRDALRKQREQRIKLIKERRQKVFHIWTIIFLIVCPPLGICMTLFDTKFTRRDTRLPVIIWMSVFIIGIIIDTYYIPDTDNRFEVLETIEEEPKIIEVTATEILKLSENNNFKGIPFNGATKEIYDVHNDKRVTISGRVEDILHDYVYLNYDDRGHNSYVVYCKVKDVSKYSIGQEVAITGVAKCYKYATAVFED